jgi:hypothetical protein
MYKASTSHTTPQLFNSLSQQLKGTKLKEFLEPTAWHNIFYESITSKIEEGIFSVLFDKATGRPNAPIRLLVAMNIIKEGHGWSDQQLFEHAQFNILVMNALGLTNLEDEVPTMSTYYLFRQKLYEYQVAMGKDLIGECFKQLTKTQANIFGVNGKQLRMDSKLIGSNIATCSRLQLIISCLQVFYKSLTAENKKKLSQGNKELMEKLVKQSSGQIVFQLSNEEKSDYLKKLGKLLIEIEKLYSEEDSDKYGLIKRIFEEQYSIEAEEIVIKENKEITANSIQSPYDDEASYRKKGDQKVQGYSVNISEICHEEGLNLITNTKVEQASKADNQFLREAIQASEEVVGEVEESYQDGAYHSQENDRYAEMNNKKLYYTGMQGKKGRFGFTKTGQELLVTDTQTGKSYQAEEYKEGKYRIKLEEGGKTKHYYFIQQAVESFFQRQEIDNLPPEIRNKRPNVEASIFQLCFLTRNNKIRYRGKYKTQLWATFRSAWINMVRIKNYVGALYPNPHNIIPLYLHNCLQKLENFLVFIAKICFENLFSHTFARSHIFI